MPPDNKSELSMIDLKKLSQETSDAILDLVAELQPVPAERVHQELASRFGVKAELTLVVKYMEWLRSSFPRKLAHAGPDLWILVDLS